MFLRQVTDSALAQNAYIIGCQKTGEAIVIDPERDIDRYLQIAEDNDLRITAVADTHIHADYLSGARELMERHGAKAYLSSEGGADWQFEWAKGHENARFLRGGETFRVGNIEFKAVSSAGHTPEHMSFLVTDFGGGAKEPMGLLSGDFIFVGDVGRPDLLESAAGQMGAMEPSARTLYVSLRATSILPEHLQILPAHGAASACGKALGAVPVSVLGYERRNNGALRQAIEGKEDTFVKDILSGQPEPPRYFARMKRDNRIGPALLPGGRLPQPRRLAADELTSFVGNESRHVNLDLRSKRTAFMCRHLSGSLFAPLAGGRLPIVAGSYVDEGAAIILLVNEESDVEEAVRQLVRIGFDNIEGWIPAAEAIEGLAANKDLITMQRSITTAELAGALKANPGATVLDVRGIGEFTAGHVRGAKHIAYTRLGARLAEVPRTNPIYVHCASGNRASFAAPYLAREKYDVVYVDGAFDDIDKSLIGNA